MSIANYQREHKILRGVVIFCAVITLGGWLCNTGQTTVSTYLEEQLKNNSAAMDYLMADYRVYSDGVNKHMEMLMKKYCYHVNYDDECVEYFKKEKK